LTLANISRMFRPGAYTLKHFMAVIVAVAPQHSAKRHSA